LQHSARCVEHAHVLPHPHQRVAAFAVIEHVRLLNRRTDDNLALR